MSERFYAQQEITGVEVEREILRLLARLEEQTGDLAVLSRDAAEKEVIHKREFAKVFLKTAGSLPLKTHTAEVKTSEHRLRRELAAGVVMSHREAISTTRAQIDALRTLSANVRAQT